ncbi:hypothetical protein B0J18DRAFT_433788 [Chaetomium sp. MPI-SDFR-AT-0129]|nr:hypothetical protein B0J18DRAFT_433788 [Chaetomium sp. MPI-SDFR-AT-0129]
MSQPQPRQTVNAPAVQGKPAATRTTPQVASTQTTTTKFTPDTTHKLYRPNLPRDIQYLRSITETFAAPDGTAICGPYVPKNELPEISFPFLPRPRVTDAGAANGNAAPGPQPNPNNVLLVIPTSNKSKTDMLLKHMQATKPAHITLTHRQIPAESGVGEQPYDDAGPRGAFTRVLNAIRTLQADPQHRKALLDGQVGTVIVGAIENFIQRPTGPGGLAVDYGVVLICRVSLSRTPGATAAAEWKWSMGVSGGVSAPTEYWKEAEKFGFEDKAGKHGKVTVGELLHINAGLDKANWHLQLAGVSRYVLLRKTMEALKVPWPKTRRAVAVAGAGAQRRDGGTNGATGRANGASVRAGGAPVRANPEATGRPKQTTQQS